ncbi:hypothetical protein PMIN04_002562 [Paraphaeosphaeria minitans]
MEEHLSQLSCLHKSSPNKSSTAQTNSATSQAPFTHGEPALRQLQTNPPCTNLFGRLHPHAGRCPLSVETQPQEGLPISSRPILYALMFVWGDEQLSPKTMNHHRYYTPICNPEMACELESRARYELYIRVG